VKADDPEAAKFVHWGATSQDIIDTATVLQLRDALDVLEPLLDEACASLATLARASRDADDRPHVAAAGAPITLGLKFAQWLDALLRHRTRFARCANARWCCSSAGQPARSRACANDAARRERRARGRLKLALPAVPWHTQRDRIAEAASCFGMLSARSARSRATCRCRCRPKSASSANRRRPARRLVDDAAQAQPGRLRGGAHRRDARRTSWRPCSRRWCRSMSARSAAGRPNGTRCPTSRA
jgi:hypothetical protein